MRLILMTLLTVFAAPALGQDLPSAVLTSVRADPGPFLTLADNLIRDFGTVDGVDQGGIDRFVTLGRSAARASARRLQRADGDFDGRVTGGEFAAYVAAMDGATQTRLWGQQQAADLDDNGVLSAVELAAFGQTTAHAALSPLDEDLARSILACDADADGYVSLQEVKSAVAALGA